MTWRVMSASSYHHYQHFRSILLGSIHRIIRCVRPWRIPWLHLIGAHRHQHGMVQRPQRMAWKILFPATSLDAHQIQRTRVHSTCRRRGGHWAWQILLVTSQDAKKRGNKMCDTTWQIIYVRPYLNACTASTSTTSGITNAPRPGPHIRSLFQLSLSRFVPDCND